MNEDTDWLTEEVQKQVLRAFSFNDMKEFDFKLRKDPNCPNL